MEFVQSHYRAPWIGVVLSRERRKHEGKRIGDLCHFLIVKDGHGNKPKSRMVRRLDVSWTKPVAPVDISHIPASWFSL